MPETTQTLVNLARDLGLNPPEGTSDEDIAREVRVRLRALPPDTLWVIDNLENLDQLNSLLSDGSSIRLLITTRDQRQWILPGGSVGFHSLDVLDRQSAIELLCSRSNLDSRESTLVAIAEMVGYMPLALELLAVRLGTPGQTPGTLLAELHRTPTPIELTKFREQQPEGASIPRIEGVFATIAGTLGRLDPELREPLAPLGYVADIPISKPLLEALAALEPGEVDRLAEECNRQSILSRSADQFLIHALTRSAIAATNPVGALETTLNRAQRRLSHIYEDDPALLRLEVAHYARIFAAAKNTLGIDHSEVHGFANSLAIGYRALGLYQEAVQLDEETWRISEQVLGPEHPNTLSGRNNLAEGYRALRRHQEADVLENR